MTPLSSGNSGTEMASVLSSNISPTQNFRFGFSTVDNGKLLHHDESGRAKTMEDNDDEHSVEDLHKTLVETYQSSGGRVRNDAVTDSGGNYVRRVSGQAYDHYPGGNSE